MNESQAKRLKALEKENAELKKMYAEVMLGIKILKEAVEKKLRARRTAGNSHKRLHPDTGAANA